MRVVVLCFGIALAGCQSTQGVWHSQSSGLRVDANQKLIERFQRDRTICDGEAAKAALGSTSRSVFEHQALVNLVFDGCLTERGYVRKPGQS